MGLLQGSKWLGETWRPLEGEVMEEATGEVNMLSVPSPKSQRGASTLCPWGLLWVTLLSSCQQTKDRECRAMGL